MGNWGFSLKDIKSTFRFAWPLAGAQMAIMSIHFVDKLVMASLLPVKYVKELSLKIIRTVTL